MNNLPNLLADQPKSWKNILRFSVFKFRYFSFWNRRTIHLEKTGCYASRTDILFGGFFGLTHTDEFTLRSIDERIIQATDPILRRLVELCALLASRTEMESASNSEAPGSRRKHEPSSPLRNR